MMLHMPCSPTETTAEPIDPVYAIEVLRALVSSDDATIDGAAWSWGQAVRVLPSVLDAVEATLAEPVCP